MTPIISPAIVLSRVNYGEADRVLTLLTPDHGKVGVIAKGVRKSKSKLAGGIELFSISIVSFIKGRSELNTLISTRLETHYDAIAKDLDRSDSGYRMIKVIHKVTDEHPDAGYFELLRCGFQALNNTTVNPHIAELWFSAHLLKLEGHKPQLNNDNAGEPLSADASYDFSIDAMAFIRRPDGQFKAGHIKLLRLGFQLSPEKLALVQKSEVEAAACLHLLKRIINYYYRV